MVQNGFWLCYFSRQIVQFGHGSVQFASGGVQFVDGSAHFVSAGLQFVDEGVQFANAGLKQAMLWQQLHLQLFVNVHVGRDFVFHDDLCH